MKRGLALVPKRRRWQSVQFLGAMSQAHRIAVGYIFMLNRHPVVDIVVK